MQQPLFDFIVAEGPLLSVKLFEQLYLVGFSVGFAILFGIPLGVAIARWPRFKKPVFGVANVLQTIPSLALLAFLLPFLGIGAKPAIVTSPSMLALTETLFDGSRGFIFPSIDIPITGTALVPIKLFQ